MTSMTVPLVLRNSLGRKVGVVVKDFPDLLEKCRIKFKMKKESQLVVKLEDDTEVDEDFFETLAPHTRLLVAEAPDTVSSLSVLMLKLEEFISQFVKDNYQVKDSLEELAQAKDISKFLYFLHKLPVQGEHMAKSSLKEDPNWFQGLNTKFATKEAILRNSAEGRIRAFYYHLKKELEAEAVYHKGGEKILSYFREKLLKERYNASYFDRSAVSSLRLCDEEGMFRCYGDFESPYCSESHAINPYGSRDSRIVFSTWNLDHVIEKSRCIIPTIKKLLRTKDISQINLKYFYNLLFVHKGCKDEDDEGNLKLVHIVCHRKVPHPLKCDPGKFLWNTSHAISRMPATEAKGTIGAECLSSKKHFHRGASLVVENPTNSGNTGRSPRKCSAKMSPIKVNRASPDWEKGKPKGETGTVASIKNLDELPEKCVSSVSKHDTSQCDGVGISCSSFIPNHYLELGSWGLSVPDCGDADSDSMDGGVFSESRVLHELPIVDEETEPVISDGQKLSSCRLNKFLPQPSQYDSVDTASPVKSKRLKLS